MCPPSGPKSLIKGSQKPWEHRAQGRGQGSSTSQARGSSLLDMKSHQDHTGRGQSWQTSPARPSWSQRGSRQQWRRSLDTRRQGSRTNSVQGAQGNSHLDMGSYQDHTVQFLAPWSTVPCLVVSYNQQRVQPRQILWQKLSSLVVSCLSRTEGDNSNPKITHSEADKITSADLSRPCIKQIFFVHPHARAVYICTLL